VPNKRIKCATYYATVLGWKIIPCAKKRPLTKEWTTRDHKIKEFISSDIGIQTGKVSGIFVLDVDGEEGRKEMRRHPGWYHGELEGPWASTPSGGFHMYFKYDERITTNHVRFLPGLDIRTDNGYVVAPPTEGYEWIRDSIKRPLEPAPEWLIKAILESTKSVKSQLKWLNDINSVVPQGQRNSTLTSIAGFLIGIKKLDKKLACQLIRAYNKCYVDPPLTDKEVDNMCEYAIKKEIKKSVNK